MTGIQAPAEDSDFVSCDDLINDGDAGTTCLDHEPLEHSGTATDIAGNLDFSDSPSTYSMTFDLGTSYDDIIAETGMPAGNTVNRVLRLEYGGTEGHGINWAYSTVPDDIDTSTRRAGCAYYMRKSADWVPVSPQGQGCDTGRSKEFQIDWGGSLELQMQAETRDGDASCNTTVPDDYGSLIFSWDEAGNSPAAYTNGGSEATYDNCRGDWCRVEVYLAGDSADLVNGDDFYLESYLTDLSDDTEFSLRMPATGTASVTQAGVMDAFDFDWFRGNGTLADTGESEYSHITCAEWETNAGQRLCSPEVESGCNGS